MRPPSAALGRHGSCRAAVDRRVDRPVTRPVMRAMPVRAAIADHNAVCGVPVLPTSLRHPKVDA